MLKKTYLGISLMCVFLLSFFIYSCRKFDSGDDTGFTKHPVAVGEVKKAEAWLGQYLRSAEVNKEFKRSVFLWQKARHVKYKDGIEVLIVPMWEPNTQYESAHIRQLVINKGYNNKYYHKVIQIAPSEGYVRKKGVFNYSQKDFTGVVMRWNLREGFKKGIEVEDGEPIGSVDLLHQDEDSFQIIKIQTKRYVPVAPPPNPYTHFLIQSTLMGLGYGLLEDGDPYVHPNEYGGGMDMAHYYETYFTFGSGGYQYSYIDYFYDGIDPATFDTPTPNDLDRYPVPDGDHLKFKHPSDPDFASDLANSTTAMPSSYFSCSTQQLRDLADAKGWTTGLTTLQINNIVGRAFEEAVVKAINTTFWSYTGTFLRHFSYPSAWRATKTAGNRVSVVPDMTFIPRVRFPSPLTLNENVLIEVKAVKGYLYPSSSQHQLAAMLNELSGQTMGNTHPPILLLVTTSDTQISEGLKNLATLHNIFLFQSYAYIDGDQLRIALPHPVNKSMLNWPIPLYAWSSAVTIEYPVVPDVSPDDEDMVP